ncbi:MAG: heme-binding protein [Actinomycetota bacterium]
MTVDLPVFEITDLEGLTGLDVDHFDNEAAVILGILGVEVIRERNANLCVQVVVGEDVAFRANLGTTGSKNDEWLAGKAAVARHFSEPSLLVKRRQEAAGTTLEQQGLDFETYRAHGGSFPIRVGGDVVGTITMSGEPDVVDHAAVAETVRRYLGR